MRNLEQPYNPTGDVSWNADCGNIVGGTMTTISEFIDVVVWNLSKNVMFSVIGLTSVSFPHMFALLAPFAI